MSPVCLLPNSPTKTKADHNMFEIDKTQNQSVSIEKAETHLLKRLLTQLCTPKTVNRSTSMLEPPLEK